MKHGDGSKINSLTVSEQNDLWDGLLSDNMEQYHKVNEKLTGQIDNLKSLSVRICRPNQPFLQLPVSPLQEDKTPTTLLHCLKSLLPKEFPQDKDDSFDFKVLIQGISVPFETPMFWLSSYFSHPDNFLYIIVKPVK